MDPSNDAAPAALVLEPDRSARTSLVAALARLGLRSRTIARGDQAAMLAREQGFAVAFVDRRSGLDSIPALLRADPRLVVVVTDDDPSIETAVEAVKAGAGGYLEKPARRGRMRRMLAELGIGGISAVPPMWRAVAGTRSPAMRETVAQIERAAGSDVPVLIRGETGTGKGSLALGLHRLGSRAAKPFVAIACPSLSPSLFLGELFGHVRGAFTDAVSDAPGKVGLADGGTLLLDEVGELAPEVQSRLLRFLQDRTYERVGETTTRTADVRIVASTARDLARDVEEGRFRADLFYRLAVVEVVLPPLRDRPEDIVDLALSFVQEAADETGRPLRSLSDDCRNVLMGYPWPGNLREMRNEIQRAIVLCSGSTLGDVDLSPRLRSGTRPSLRVGGPYALEAVASEHIRRVVDGSRTLEEAAQVLGIQPSTLWRRRRELGLAPRRGSRATAP